MHRDPASRRPTSLRSKLVRILLLVSVLTGVSTLSIVVVLNVRASARELARVEQTIQEGIVSKGRLLTKNHALALRSLTLDNAFLDMQRLVERAVQEEQDLAYGVFVDSQRQTLAASVRGESAGKADPPSSDAWRAFGLGEAELLVDAPVTKRKVFRGEDVLEVAVPVATEEGEKLGTIRYGLSLGRVHEAIAQAKLDAREQLRNSVLSIAGLVVTATLLGLLLSRHQAVHVTKPVEALTRAAEELAGGKRSVTVHIESGDELEVLGASFNRMVGELDSSYRELEQMNRTLEHKVEERTAELAVRNRDMQLVLDNVDQGFVTVSPDGTMGGERSRVVDEWFGAPDGALTLWDYTASASRKFASEFRLGWEQLSEGLMPLEVCVSQLPRRLSSGPRTYSVRYLPILQGERFDGMLVVIADVSERLAHEKDEAEQSELIQAFKKVMADRSGFTAFLREAGAMVRVVVSHVEGDDVVSLKRTLHTLKGNTAMMGLAVLAKLCHALEEELAENGSMVAATMRQLRSRFSTVHEHVMSFIGHDEQRVLEVPELEYRALIARLHRKERQEDVLRQVLGWQLEPAARWFSRLAEQAKALSRRLGKGDIEVEIIGEDVRLDPEVWNAFFTELAHVVRNAVDHGFESLEERKARGTTTRPKLCLKADVSHGLLTFEVGDDGRGIDWERVKNIARERGLPHATPSQQMAAVCADGVTTRAEVSDVSGRGVGMASFRRKVEAMHGRLEVRSARGAGTSWFAFFQWPDERSSRPSRSVPESATGT
jgi:two-component system chemotaxis sensor kinase CheA